MKKIVVVTAVLLTLGASSGVAEARPGGCLKYGLGGAVAGHVAGGHRWKGALAGCALGIFQRRRHERALAERRRYQERARFNREADLRRGPSRYPEATGSLVRSRSY